MECDWNLLLIPSSIFQQFDASVAQVSIMSSRNIVLQNPVQTVYKYLSDDQLHMQWIINAISLYIFYLPFSLYFVYNTRIYPWHYWPSEIFIIILLNCLICIPFIPLLFDRFYLFVCIASLVWMKWVTWHDGWMDGWTTASKILQ